MKVLVMTAQDAREFEKLGGLTITKPIKPAPPYIEGAKMVPMMSEKPNTCAYYLDNGVGMCGTYEAPVVSGDIVFLREPWARFKNPANGEPSDRVILAADSTVAEGQTSYKWASPVSMPESAARRFAVVRKVEPIYNENVAVWSITLEAVTKAAAEAGEAEALLYSSATEQEAGSDYFTYAGDMSPEDHERMVAAINADRAHLAEVQDRLIRIDLRRREIALQFGAGIADEAVSAAMTEEESTLAAEQGELEDQEADLRRALEDHAREKLAALRAHFAECPDDAQTALAEVERERPPSRTRQRLTRRSAPSLSGDVTIAGGSGALPWREQRAEAIPHRKRPTPPRPAFAIARRP